MSQRIPLRIHGERVLLLPHAVERYIERACRHDDKDLAIEELVLLLDRHASIDSEIPDWVHPSAASENTDAWLTLGTDIAFPLERSSSGRLAAMTCMCRNGVGYGRHAHRRKRHPKAHGHVIRVARRLRRDQLKPSIEEI